MPTRATAVMDEHLEAVAGRALIVSRPPRDYDIKNILARYADDAPASLRRQRARASSGRPLTGIDGAGISDRQALEVDRN